MARIPILDENDPNLPAATRDALELATKSRGRLVNIYRVLANRPEALVAFNQLAQTVYRSGTTLAPKQAEIAYLTATAVNDCYY